MSRYAPTFWMTTYGVLRQLPTVMSPYGSAKPSSAVAYALFTTSMLVRVLYERPVVSNALTRAEVRPDLVRDALLPGLGAIGELRRAAPPGRRCRCRTTWRSPGTAASRLFGALRRAARARRRPWCRMRTRLSVAQQAESNGRAAVDARAARTSRRLTMTGRRADG